MILIKYKKKLVNRVAIKDKLKKFNFMHSKVRLCRLYVRRSFTNLFITLADMNKKVIYTVSAGSCSMNNNSRIKNSLLTFETVISRLCNKLKLYNLYNIEIIIRSRIRWQLKNLTRILTDKGYNVTRIIDRRITAHNGVRSKNTRKR